MGASLLHDALTRLARRSALAALNLWVRTAPRGPSISAGGSTSFPPDASGRIGAGAGVHLNIVAPERAAAELRDA